MVGSGIERKNAELKRKEKRTISFYHTISLFWYTVTTAIKMSCQVGHHGYWSEAVPQE